MRTVLCVAVDATLAELSTTIREAGYRCLTASSGEEAERLFVANSVDLVFLYNGDPGMHGDALASHLKKIRAVKILMLSPKLGSTGMPKSVDILLTLPGTPNALLDAVALLMKDVDSQARLAKGSQ